MKQTPLKKGKRLKRKTPLSYRPQKDGKLWSYNKIKKSVKKFLKRNPITEERFPKDFSQLKKKRKPMKQRSDKRVRDEKEYRKLSKQFLKDHPECERSGCSHPSTQVHHKAKRERHFLNVATFMACCAGCHREIEDDRKWAEFWGYTYPTDLIRRLGDFNYWEALS